MTIEDFGRLSNARDLKIEMEFEIDRECEERWMRSGDRIMCSMDLEMEFVFEE